MKKYHIIFLPLVCLIFGGGGQGAFCQTYKPTWESLSRHQTPEWFRDAKFGIYTHWGPVTVGAEEGPAGVQWYGYNMYRPESPTFQYHQKKYGDQHSVGYKDMVKRFVPDKFDAEEWAELFKKAGAKFAGPVAIHHDNYAMWDSALTEWDSVDQPAHCDFIGELESALRKRNIKLITTFHHAFSWRYFEPSYQYDGADPKYAGLYCEAHTPGAPPTSKFQDQYLGKVNEVIAKYKPDLIWFDFGLGDKKRNCITPAYQKRVFADYYNWAVKNSLEVDIAHKHPDIHRYAGILDFERGREERITPYPWLTDTSIGPWFHQKSHRYKTVNQIVDVLIDIVSKNGCMLLNVGPAADGSIPAEAQNILLGIGDWLKLNGEAIYNTRPWKIYGEGPTRQERSGGFSEYKDRQYTPRDIRFTQSKDGATLYTILLAWPGEDITIKALGSTLPLLDKDVDRVSMLGVAGDLKWIRHENGFTIQMPSQEPCKNAYVCKISLQEKP